MDLNLAAGLAIPFFGTAIGSACVFFMKDGIGDGVRRLLIGFAGGVMVAASVWSLLIPALEQAAQMGMLPFVPAVVGFWLGILFLTAADRMISKSCADGAAVGTGRADGKSLRRTAMLVLAVVIHNIPEGMAVGAVYAGWLSGNAGISLAGAFALSVGVAIQNFPEGAIISMPLCAEGMKKRPAFICGVLSGAVEPIGGALTVLLSCLIVPVMPCFLSFAAGAMMYVVIREMIPEMSDGDCGVMGTVIFSIGFTLMMAIDVALG